MSSLHGCTAPTAPLPLERAGDHQLQPQEAANIALLPSASVNVFTPQSEYEFVVGFGEEGYVALLSCERTVGVVASKNGDAPSLMRDGYRRPHCS